MSVVRQEVALNDFDVALNNPEKYEAQALGTVAIPKVFRMIENGKVLPTQSSR